MFDFSHLSDDDKIARDVFRGKQDAVAKLGDTPNDSMKPHILIFPILSSLSHSTMHIVSHRRAIRPAIRHTGRV